MTLTSRMVVPSCHSVDTFALSEGHHLASSIISPSNPSIDKLEFYYRAVLLAIDSCLSGKYTDFDGHTTSNCCHGMAVLASSVIRSALQLDLQALQQEGEQKIQELNPTNPHCTWRIPQPVINLTCLYLLGLIKESDPIKGGRTSTKKLKTIAPISTNFCNQVAHNLQKYYSNVIAAGYEKYAQAINPQMQISGAPITMWQKYISSDYIRTDRRGVKYTSNLFSMQIIFAHLIQSRARVALVNDILDYSGNLQGRYLRLFQGDGHGALQPLTSDEIKQFQFSHQDEPIIVFGGCIYSDHLEIDSLSMQMEAWLHRFPNLMLACDVFYPQFLKVTDDPDFDCSPIIPNEQLLQTILSSHQNIQGVSASDPSLFCATHIYPASLKQVLKVLNGEDKKALPISFIPGVKLNDTSKTNPKFAIAPSGCSLSSYSVNLSLSTHVTQLP